MTWWETVIGAGFGAALVQGLFPFVRDWRHKKSQANYMAMRLAVTLEFYASACADLIQKNANAEPPPTDEFGGTADMPELSAYPDDAEGWRAIDSALAGRCLNLRNKIHGSQGAIDSTIEYRMDDLEDTIAEQAAERGLEAWHLAVALRRKHGVAKADIVWNYVETLEGTLQKLEKARR